MPLNFKNSDPACDNFQYLEDLSCAYWYSQVLFTSLELELFSYIDKGFCKPKTLAAVAGCKKQELLRLLCAMENLALVSCHENNWYNSQVSSKFLVPGKSSYMGDFFLYRKYMQPNWESLSQKIALKEEKETETAYSQKNDRYVAAMDTLVKQKAKEIATLLEGEKIQGIILDVGGGAGTMIREILKKSSADYGILFDIPEVIDSAQRLYQNPDDWDRITAVNGDFRTYEFKDEFSLIILSNFLHAYHPKEACDLLIRATGLLKKNGIILIHDYFPDLKGAVPEKGALYDISMMLNTYNGVCHTSETIIRWLGRSGLENTFTKELKTDSSVIMAARNNRSFGMKTSWNILAAKIGFDKIAELSPKDVVLGEWVGSKCRFGCERFNKNLKCPPHSMSLEKTSRLLSSYTKAFLVKGSPPGNDFYKMLLTLEKKAFLKGFHKAFVFGAGPCTVCPDCPDDGVCRFPHLARPSMEGSGIDVYSTVQKVGWSLEPVRKKGMFVTYIGLFLLE